MYLKIFLALFFIALAVLPAAAQHCGGSYRTIPIEYADGVKPAETVEYELFYLIPKGKARIDFEKRAEFVSRFLYNRKYTNEGHFWATYHDTAEFLRAQEIPAMWYLMSYKLEDFKAYSEIFDHHAPQLKGKATDRGIKFETRETDDTAFLMRVSATGFKTQYYVSSFLGGCHDSLDTKPAIKMQAKEVKTCDKATNVN